MNIEKKIEETGKETDIGGRGKVAYFLGVSACDLPVRHMRGNTRSELAGELQVFPLLSKPQFLIFNRAVWSWS